MESQDHGFTFEDEIIFQMTGMSKKEYNKKEGIAHTDKFDLKPNKLYNILEPISVKTSSNRCVYWNW